MFEYFRVVFCQRGEDFPIQLYVVRFERMNQFAVRERLKMRTSVYFYIPELPAHTFFLVVVIKAVNTRVQKRFTGLPFF